MKTVKEKQFFIKLNEIHTLEIIVTDTGEFKAFLQGRNLNKSGISGDKSKLNFRLDYDSKAVILIKNDKTEEIVQAEKAFNYYFKLLEYKEALKKAELIDSGELREEIKTVMLDEIWESMEDILFVEDEEQDNDTLTLGEDFFIWDKGTPRMEIWHWFDKRYPGGLGERL